MSSYAYPRQLQAIGKNRVAGNAEIEATAFVDSNKQGLDHLLNPLVGRIQDVKLCLLGEATALEYILGAPVRWRYTLQTVWVPTNGSANVYTQYVFDPQDPLSFNGFNIYEWNHVLSNTTGDGSQDLALWISAGNRITPVVGIVFAYAVRMNWTTTSPASDTNLGDIIWLFDRANGYVCVEGGGGGGGG
jgi:hypothetical protein